MSLPDTVGPTSQTHRMGGVDPGEGGGMDLNGILIGSEDPTRLTDYYTEIFGKPAWEGGGFTGWQLGPGWMAVGPHDQVKGKNTQPGRVMWNIQTPDVKGDFDGSRPPGQRWYGSPTTPARGPRGGSPRSPIRTATTSSSSAR